MTELFDGPPFCLLLREMAGNLSIGWRITRKHSMMYESVYKLFNSPAY